MNIIKLINQQKLVTHTSNKRNTIHHGPRHPIPVLRSYVKHCADTRLLRGSPAKTLFTMLYWIVHYKVFVHCLSDFITQRILRTEGGTITHTFVIQGAHTENAYI